MKAKDALYAEAEAVYRRTVQIRMDAYSGRPIPDLTTVAVGSGLESFKADIAQGYRLEAGSFTVVRVERKVGESREGSIVALTSCLDSTGVSLYRGAARVDLPARGRESTFYRRDGGQLKLAAITTKVDAQC